MSVIEITASAAGVIAAGVWLRWAATPVIGAYKLGRKLDQLTGRRSQ